MTAKKILLIEDDPKSLFALQTILEDRGHSVHAFPSAEEAVRAPTNHFDTAIIDVRLPEQQGPDFARTFQKKNPTSRIIFITAYDVAPHLRDSLPNATILTKPLDMDALTDLL